MDDMKTMERRELGGRAKIAHEHFHGVLEELKRVTVNGLINQFVEGKIDSMAVAKLAAIRDIEIKMRTQVNRGIKADDKIVNFKPKGD